ncbi:MAG: hypothetical protein LLG02_11720 [Pelosinus sp.]|nr:hypothetical protein [Pelosinus sp.]
MDIDKVAENAENYQKTLSRLSEAVNEPNPTEYVYDAVVNSVGQADGKKYLRCRILKVFTQKIGDENG